MSDQFHVVYDERYSTAFGELSERAFDKATWQDLYQLGSERASDLDHELVSPDKKEAHERVRTDVFRRFVDPDCELTPPPPVPEGDGFFGPILIPMRL